MSDSYNQYDHTSAKNKIEAYFWDIIADNYLEMVKNRLYDHIDGAPEKESAKYTVYQVLLTIIKMLAPIMPYVTEEIFHLVFKKREGEISIHLTDWPKMKAELINSDAEAVGEVLVEIATAARRYKSTKQLPMSTPLRLMKVATPSGRLLNELKGCITDIRSVTRAGSIELERSLERASPNVQITEVIVHVE